MLCELTIRNFAIIDDLNISFFGGLTVLSGETGAGKSIIINAVNLLLGSRASSKVIRTGAECAELEAFFEIPADSKAAKTMGRLGYDAAEGLLIRRIITRSDRHKIYINGRMATMQVLNAVTENLASISGQHAYQGLLKEDRHLMILDQFGGLLPLRNQVHELYHEMIPAIETLDRLKRRQKRQAELEELLNFQKREIESADVKPGEDLKLEDERLRLRHARQLYQSVHESIDDLYDADKSVWERLATVIRRIEPAAQIDSRLKPQLNSLNDVTYRIEDIHQSFRSYLDALEIDESRLEWVEARLDTLNRLSRKYGGNLDAVQNHVEKIINNLSEIETLSEKILEAETVIKNIRENLGPAAETLSRKRQDMAVHFAEAVESELATLKMSQTQFEISLEKTKSNQRSSPTISWNGFQLCETGFDQAEFMISPNIGEEMKPLASIASGGELSRVVLALKAMRVVSDALETVVFDEVDAGIGGDVADLVGTKLRKLSKSHQVICITHLPQIARFADHHYRISKHVSDGRTHAEIHPVAEELRVEEIARMLGGSNITQTTLDHAHELLKVRE